MKLKLLHKLRSTEIEVHPSLPLQELKSVASEFSGIPMDLLKFLFRGRTCSEESTVEGAGMKDGSKVHVIQSISGSAPAAPEKTTEDASASTLSEIEKEVDEIAAQVELMNGGDEVAGKKIPTPVVMTELLTQKLLRLDNLDVSGEIRSRRKALINRINALCAQLDQANPGDQ